jgi:adenine-specific DNA-methyltransferase
MPTLHWIGKEKVINHHRDVPFKVLEHKYGFDNGVQSEIATNSGNVIIHGDNLEALKALLPQYEGKVKCIYIDPPYNTGNEGWKYNDNVNHPKIKKWLGEVVGKEGEDLSRHDKWLCMMYPRLKLLHKLLCDDGVIFISIDDNEYANLKLICDEIFGSRNFINNIIWQKKTGASDAKNIANITEYIMIYSKNHINPKLIFQKNKDSYDLKRYKYSDSYLNTRGPYYIDNLDRGGLQYSDSLNFKIECPDNSFTYPNGRNEFENDGWIWKWSEAKVKWAIENDFIEFRKSKNKKSGWSVCYKNYLHVDNKGNITERAAPKKNIITEILNANAASDLKDIFGTNVFNYSKPFELVKNILSYLKLDKNSIILDSFAGSGTTAHAVLNLNKRDGGNRKFICIEMEDYAETITSERVKRVIKGYGSGAKKVEGTGGSFDFYALGHPIFVGDNNEYLNEEIDLEKIKEYIWYSETRSPYSNPTTEDTIYFLGKKEDTAYYFIYEKEAETTLDYDSLSEVKTRSQQYVIYADNCLLSKEFMMTNNIIFKKIPRDVTRF